MSNKSNKRSSKSINRKYSNLDTSSQLFTSYKLPNDSTVTDIPDDTTSVTVAFETSSMQPLAAFPECQTPQEWGGANTNLLLKTPTTFLKHCILHKNGYYTQ